MRVLNLFGEINDTSSAEILEKIFEFEAADEKIKDKDYLEPITLNISSEGGYMHNMYAIYDAFKNLKCKKITRAWGKCSSGAIDLFLLGDKRYIGANTDFTWHSMSYCVNLNVHEQKDYTAHQLKRQKGRDEILISKTKMTQKQLNKYKYTDCYITPEKAVELGIAHEII